MPYSKRKFIKRPGYHVMHKLEHKGKIGYNKGENIVVHVCSFLDSDASYKTINGKLHVRDLNVVSHHGRDGKPRFIKDSGKFIPVEEHNRRYYPKLRNPSVI